ncbi:MAG TPA: glycosyltransferase family 2 protein [Tepidisphaeraceae bacterium]|nr:glycosyltransferase family 2 protein [Tepidisphaeraceae bacterium]
MTLLDQPPSDVRDTIAPRLGVVTPLANEEQTVAQFLQRVLAQLTLEDRVFCVVDNASHDATRQRVEDVALKDSRVVLVWAPENRCVVDAYFRGYREALAAGCRWILEMDGGLSHLPEQIPQFIAAMERGHAFAAGSRFMRGGRFNGKLSRRLVSKGGTILSNLVLGTRMHDMCSGFECFTHETLRRVVEHGVKSRAHFFQTEIRFFLRNCDWVEIPITYNGPTVPVPGSSISEAIKILFSLRQHANSSPEPSRQRPELAEGCSRRTT